MKGHVGKVVRSIGYHKKIPGARYGRQGPFISSDGPRGGRTATLQA